MRFSERYGLGVSQGALDFVDVDIDNDVRLFVDPRALRLLQTEWGARCRSLIQTFFDAVIEAIVDGQHDTAMSLLSPLREPSETGLGHSVMGRRGSGVGDQLAQDIFDALSGSKVATTGLIQDLEDTALLIPGISSDRVSDIATNVLREPLAEYTAEMCDLYDIVPEPGVAVGPYWDGLQWRDLVAPMPIPNDEFIMLVPRAIVRRDGALEGEKRRYYNNFVLPMLVDRERGSGNSELIRLVKDRRTGKTRTEIYRTDVRKKYGDGKIRIVTESLADENLFARFKATQEKVVPPPLTPVQMLGEVGGDPVDWDALLDAIVALDPGKEDATRFHRATQDLLTAMFDPELAHPIREFPLHDRRKMIDIVYTNVADQQTGRDFWGWVARHHPAATVPFECKNYVGDLKNTEIDQLTGRFSPVRGRVGVIVCRRFKDKPTFVKRCRDVVADDRGFPMVLDDSDMRLLAGYRKDLDAAVVTGDASAALKSRTDFFEYLQRRFRDCCGDGGPAGWSC